MIPPTKNGLPAMGVLSALQKLIRRGLELEAMRMAVELHQTSRNFAKMVCNRLEVIAHEDIDTQASPWIVPFVNVAAAQAMLWYDADKLGRSRMPIGNAIRMMARAPKSRQGDHFQAAVGQAAELEHYVPTIPEWANDGHTLAGKRQGRGLDYFRTVSTVLIPPPAAPDPYEAEAYRLWALRDTRKSGAGVNRQTKRKHAARGATQQTALDLGDLGPRARKAGAVRR
jgi:hypothetical protein